jgi:hypothetical protein
MFIMCESLNDYLIDLKNGLIISYARRDFAYGIKKVVNVDFIDIEPSFIFLNFENCLSCRVFAIFRQSYFMYYFLNLDHELIEFLLIILFSLKAIFNSVSEKGLDLIFNNLSQFYHSIKNLTLICESKNFRNRIKITDSIVNARNRLISAHTNEFLSRSHNVACKCKTDNVNIKMKK